jgi:hypothetical protein
MSKFDLTEQHAFEPSSSAGSNGSRSIVDKPLQPKTQGTSVMRPRATRMGCIATAFVAVVFAAVAVAPAAPAQAADTQVQIDSFTFAPQRLSTDATSGRALRPSARRGMKGWIALHRPDGALVHIKVEQIVFVSAAAPGAADRARSHIQLLNGYSSVRETVEEVMQALENEISLATDGS